MCVKAHHTTEECRGLAVGSESCEGDEIRKVDRTWVKRELENQNEKSGLHLKCDEK
jgi:hypothetical protein